MFCPNVTNLICRVHQHPLEYTCYGKPNPFVFKNAEILLEQLVLSLHHVNAGIHHFKTLYMIGDNPLVDIKGAKKVCRSSEISLHFLYASIVSIVRL